MTMHDITQSSHPQTGFTIVTHKRPNKVKPREVMTPTEPERDRDRMNVSHVTTCVFMAASDHRVLGTCHILSR